MCNKKVHVKSCCTEFHDGVVISNLSTITAFDVFDTQFCPVTGAGVVAFIPNNKTSNRERNKHTYYVRALLLYTV